MTDAPTPTTKKIAYYTGCRCLRCKAKFDTIATTITTCPTCNTAIDPSTVWATRCYEGHTVLPSWLRAFGWPLLVIFAGVAFGAFEWLVLGVLHLSFVAVVIATGAVWFFVKLLGADE